MPESVHEQISAAIKTRLKTIVSDAGETYWYTPDRVVRCLEWPNTFDVSGDHAIYIRPDQDSVTEGGTGDATSGGRVDGEAPFSLLIVRKYERSDRDPIEEDESPDPIGPTVIGRCVKDVRRALLREVTLGGIAWNVADGQITADYSFQVGGAFLSALMTFTVRYDYLALA